MVKVIHMYGRDTVEKDSDSDCFVLTNNIGGYASFSNKPISKYQGIVFDKDFEVFKTINNIEILDAPPIDTIVNKFEHINRNRGCIQEHFLMLKDHNAFIYWLDEPTKVKISFDCRKLFDSREWGRFYDIYDEEDKIIIEYTKKNDERDYGRGDMGEYKIFIAIATDSGNYDKINTWRKEEYSFDENRGSINGSARYVYDAILMDCKTLVFGFSTNKDEAISEVNHVLENFSTSTHNKLDFVKKKKVDKEVNMAYICAQNSMNQLVQNISNVKGIYAGIWWFCQYWTRDTAVSLKSLMLEKKYNDVKDILFDYINRLENDGRILNRIPRSDLASADGVGWIFKRFGDFIEILEKEKKVNKYFSQEDIKLVKKKLKEAVKNLNKFHTKDGLAINSAKETWMDTAANTGDVRDGARIEIQALRLNMYKLLKKFGKLSHDDRTYGEAKKLEESMLKKVRKTFWNGEYLKDGKDDETIRPNIFLAYYIYPELLEKKEWTTCFDNIINKLWCEWGGITSIDKNSKLYVPNHTGENNLSYHRGDSWYWINNLAALCMNDLDKDKYSVYITDILNASSQEILWKGCLGGHAELSSAEKQESYGCLNQTWSNAMFIELVNEIFT